MPEPDSRNIKDLQSAKKAGATRALGSEIGRCARSEASDSSGQGSA